MKTHVIQLNAFDDSFSIADKMSWSKANRILVVWPDKGHIVLNELDMLLLQRKAESLGAQLAFVCDEARIIDLCRQSGLQFFSSIPDAYKHPWRRSKRIKRRISARENTRDVPGLIDFFAKKHEKQAETPRWLRIGIFSVAVLAILTLIGFFLPSAVVEISPVHETVSLTVPVWSSPNIERVNVSGAVPAQVVTIEMSDRIEGASSGSVRIPGAYASGSLVFRNLSNLPVSIPAGTVVRSSGETPLRFQTTRAVSLPGTINAEATVDAVSLEGGVIGNAAAFTINAIEGAVGANVAVENRLPFTGGAELKTPAPSAADFENAKQTLLAKMQDEVLDVVKTRYPLAYLIAEDTLTLARIIEETRTPQADSPGEYFEYAIRCEYSVWIISREDIEAIANHALRSFLGANYEIIPETAALRDATRPEYDASDHLRWEIEVTQQIRPVMEAARLQTLLAGAPVDAALNLLRAKGLVFDAQSSFIDVRPPFWQRLPFLPFRIQVLIHE